MATAVLQLHEAAPITPYVARARALIQKSRSASTVRGYRADFRDFAGFCASLGVPSLPASPETLCSYLGRCADSGLKSGSIQRRVSSIAAAHSSAGLESPTAAAPVRLCLAGIRRELGTRQNGKAPVLTPDVAAMLSHVPSGLLGLRDRALLLLGFAGALRRSELVGLNVEDIQFTEDGAKVLIRRSKADQEAEGQTIGIARGLTLCPVKSLEVWLAGAGIATGPVFRSVNRHGQVQPSALTDQVVALVVKRYAAAAGLDPRNYAGHSLRAGLVTSAAMNNVPEYVIQKQTRHKSTDMLRRYIRDASLFRDNASARVGL